jgi:hypothetical protein
MEELRNFGLWKVDAKIKSIGSTMVFGEEFIRDDIIAA